MRQSLQEMAQNAFEVEIAGTLAEGTCKLAESHDVILTDLNLPDSDGFDTFLRVQRAAQGLPVVVLSDETLGLKAIQAEDPGLSGQNFD